MQWLHSRIQILVFDLPDTGHFKAAAEGATAHPECSAVPGFQIWSRIFQGTIAILRYMDLRHSTDFHLNFATNSHILNFKGYWIGSHRN